MKLDIGRMNKETNWTLPDPTSVREIHLDDDSLVFVRRYGNPAGHRLILSHGNGLAIDLYYPFWSLLIDDFDLIVYDLRNHGWNSVGRQENHNIPTFVRDLGRILDQIDVHFGAKPAIGVFHSISAFVALLYSSDLKALMSSTESPDFLAMVLFDPPIFKPGHDDLEFDEAVKTTAKLMRIRGNSFKSTDEFTDLIRYSPNFQNFVPGAIEIMAKKTLRKCTTGECFELRCPPEFEAQIIDYFRSYSVMLDFDTLVCPTKIIGADPLVPYAYLPTLDFSDVVSVDYDFLPDSSHFLQLEQPEQCADEVKAFINSMSLLSVN